MASAALKRSVEEEPISSNVVDMLTSRADDVQADRASSPLSSAGSTAPPLPAATTDGSTAATGPPPAKKRKLTVEEKEAAQVEKERLQQEKAAQKAQKEEERRLKLEEKRAKDEEKEEKRRMKDAEKAAKEQEKKDKQDRKDAERKAKDDEKAKKERAQMRLTGFFGKPKAGSPPAVSPASSRRGSIASIDEEDVEQITPAKPTKHALFLPFELPSHSTIAPYNRFDRDGPALSFACQGIDDLMTASKIQSSSSPDRKRALEESFRPPLKRRRYVGPISVKAIITSLQSSRDQPIDLTSSSELQFASPLEELKKVPVKQFKFREDVRPPYIGTFSRVPERRSIKSLSRRPFERALPKIDYDYDSEAEWEEPEEGEDLVSEGEEDGDDNEVDEMDDFLDDEDIENGPRRRQVVDVPPLQTDMHWEIGRRSLASDTVAMGESTVDLGGYRIEHLLEESLSSIDPFSHSYWQTTPASNTNEGSVELGSTMAPPRLPLSSIPGAANISLGLGSSPLGAPSSPLNGAKSELSQASKCAAVPGTVLANPGKGKGRPAAQPFPPELMYSFKEAILQYKELTKVGMIEVLKKKFSAVSRVTVAETLEQVAARVGEKQADKHWQLKP